MIGETFELQSPTGDEIRGTYELVPGVASVEFLDAEASFDHSGSTEMFWDDSVTQTIKGSTLFTDGSGDNWLTHHLIPPGAAALSAEAVAAMKTEISIGRLLNSIEETAARAERLNLRLLLVRGAVEQVSALYSQAAKRSIELRQRDLDAQSAPAGQENA